MRYQAVIFDLGGTLINQSTWDEQTNYVRRMASVLGAPFEDFVRVWRTGYEDRTKGTFKTVQDYLRHVCHQFHVSVDDSRIELASNIPLDITRRQVMAPREEAVEVLSQLKSHGCKTGLVSNWSAHLPAIWNDTPLAPLIDVAVISSSVGLMKPDPSFFLLAAERLRAKPEECLYVADGMDGELSAASKVGMTAVMVRFPGEIDANPYREEWGGQVIASLREALALVDGSRESQHVI